MAAEERLLITGGSGFIGTYVADLALQRGMQIRNIDLVQPRKPEHLACWRQLDVRDADGLMEAVRSFQPDRLLHLASDIDVNISSLSEFKTTIDGTANILKAAKAVPQLKRFVHVSTQYVVMPGVEPSDERHLEPYTVYGQAKAETERLVWGADLDVPWFIVRPVIIWGPYHPTFATQIFKHIGNRTYLHPSDRMPIFRAYGYVGNVASQMMQLATIGPGLTDRHVYYLGDGSLNSGEWVDAFALGLTGRKAKRIPVPLLRLLGRFGDGAKSIGLPAPINSGRVFRMTTSSHADFGPTFELLGKPPISFQDGVNETLNWLKREYGVMTG